MKIELTEQQFRYLLDLVYIGNWVINSTRENDRIQEYDQVESLIFSHCLHHKMSKLVELYRGELIPSRAFADGGIHEAIEQYEDVVFYEILAEELALRDMDGEPLTRENYGELMERIDAYLSEFDEHGTDNISCRKAEGTPPRHRRDFSPGLFQRTEREKGATRSWLKNPKSTLRTSAPPAGGRTCPRSWPG